MARASRTRRLAIAAGSAVAIIVAALIAADVGSKPPRCIRFSESLRGRKSFEAPPCRFIDDAFYDVKMQTSLGVINLRLDTRLDGNAVNNFVFLARVGFYDGMTFHRVEADEDHAYVQTGDPGGTGRGTAGYTWKADAPSPITQYIRGMVAMAHPPGRLDLTSSQFFIIVRDWDEISGGEIMPEYPFFGYVADRASEAVLDAIVAAPRRGTVPEPPIVIEKVTVTEAPFFPGEDE